MSAQSFDALERANATRRAKAFVRRRVGGMPRHEGLATLAGLLRQYGQIGPLTSDAHAIGAARLTAALAWPRWCGEAKAIRVLVDAEIRGGDLARADLMVRDLTAREALVLADALDPTEAPDA